MKRIMPSMEIPKRPAICPDHGEFESRCYLGNVWTKCPTCCEEEEQRERDEAAAKEREARNRAWLERLGHAQIPERFADRTLDNYIVTDPRQQHALDFCRRYADEFDEVVRTGRSAIFVGGPGTGKTHLAIGVAHQVLKNGRAAIFLTVQRAIRRIKDTWNRGSSETESQTVRALTYPDLLILDEVGIQHGSETERHLLFDVLNERYENNKPTIYLSNLTIEEVKPFLGERVFSRMREGGGEVVPFSWGDYRGSL